MQRIYCIETLKLKTFLWRKMESLSSEISEFPANSNLAMPKQAQVAELPFSCRLKCVSENRTITKLMYGRWEWFSMSLSLLKSHLSRKRSTEYCNRLLSVPSSPYQKKPIPTWKCSSSHFLTKTTWKDQQYLRWLAFLAWNKKFWSLFKSITVKMKY